MPQPPARNPLGSPFVELQSVDSTNNYAREQVYAGLAPAGTALFAYEQWKGKGQRGKSWESSPGENVVLTVLIDASPIKITNQFLFSAAMALGVRDFFSRYAGDETRVKWPNDLYWQDRKAGGILIENIIRAGEESADSHWKWSIVGVGININQVAFDPALSNPVSLKQITGRHFESVKLARELCTDLDRWLTTVTEKPENILDQYRLHLYKKGESVKLRKEGRVFDAEIRDVNHSGELLIAHAMEEWVRTGDIEWIPASINR